MKNYAIMLLFDVDYANPNGDPETGRPRISPEGKSVITPECIKHKLRIQMMRRGDDVLHLHDGYEEAVVNRLKEKGYTYETFKEGELSFCDIRLFGATDKKKGIIDVTIPGAFTPSFPISIDKVDMAQPRVNRSYMVADEKLGNAYAMDGHIYVQYALYPVFWRMNYYAARDNGVTDKDVQKMLEAMTTLFADDSSTNRPPGSMNVRRIYVWEWEGDGIHGPSDVQLMNSIVVKKKYAIPYSFEDYDIDCTFYERGVDQLCRMELYYDNV